MRIRGITRVISLEIARGPRYKQVGLVLSNGGLKHNSDSDTIRGITALGDRANSFQVSLQTWIGQRLHKCTLRRTGEVYRGFADHSSLIAVLHIGTNAGKVDQDRDIKGFKLLLWSDTAELEKLWCIKGTGGDDNFAVGANASGSARFG